MSREEKLLFTAPSLLHLSFIKNASIVEIIEIFTEKNDCNIKKQRCYSFFKTFKYSKRFEQYYVADTKITLFYFFILLFYVI